jgi:hypothetical protein
MKRILLVVMALMATISVASAQTVQGSGIGSSLRVTVLDPTDAALIIAQVTVVDARGVEQARPVDDRGIAIFENLVPGNYQVKAAADGFRPITTPITVRRGENRTTLRLALATIEQSIVVQDQDAANRRDNGFTQTLTQEQIDALPDDPEEMADELMRMAGPGAHLRQRLSRRPHAAEGSDSADPLSHQLVLIGVPRRRDDSRRGHYQAGHGRVERHDQLRVSR